jgi:hypothetical protein
VERRFRDRQESLRRHPATRDPKLRILVVCEGRKTEPAYFKAFQHHVRNQLVHVEIQGKGGVPKTVVDLAIELRNEAEREAKAHKDENLRFDEVWWLFRAHASSSGRSCTSKSKPNKFTVMMRRVLSGFIFRDMTRSWISGGSSSGTQMR